MRYNDDNNFTRRKSPFKKSERIQKNPLSKNTISHYAAPEDDQEDDYYVEIASLAPVEADLKWCQENQSERYSERSRKSSISRSSFSTKKMSQHLLNNPDYKRPDPLMFKSEAEPIPSEPLDSESSPDLPEEIDQSYQEGSIKKTVSITDLDSHAEPCFSANPSSQMEEGEVYPSPDQNPNVKDYRPTFPTESLPNDGEEELVIENFLLTDAAALTPDAKSILRDMNHLLAKNDLQSLCDMVFDLEDDKEISSQMDLDRLSCVLANKLDQ
jgi:hypothetical protein